MHPCLLAFALLRPHPHAVIPSLLASSNLSSLTTSHPASPTCLLPLAFPAASLALIATARCTPQATKRVLPAVTSPTSSRLAQLPRALAPACAGTSHAASRRPW
eukprot:4944393-Pleurochrysis_carterae.AAC.2